MNKVKVLRIIGSTFVVLGLFGVTPTLYYRYRLSKVNAAPLIPVDVPSLARNLTPETITGKANKLAIQSLGLEVPVVDGAYDPSTKQWTLGLHTAQYAMLSTPPNNTSGMTYIYGHYRPEVFAPLHKIPDGAEAIVTTDNGYKFTYKLREKHDVAPEDTKIFEYQGAPILVLQTCSGLWFQNRQQFTFDFVKYEKI